MQPGDTVADRFELLELAGEGGMGLVFRARDRQSDTDVALKVLRESESSRQLASRFLREARVLSELSHPGVVRHVAHGVDSRGRYYLAMEWLKGEDLSARLARAGLTINESLILLRAAASAIAHAHERGIVHRDLKPANLFLVDGRPDWVKVLDFGLARLKQNHQMTRAGAPMGTLGYMAPEQARGAGDVDARADVFSLGCVLFECLTGRPAFWADHALTVLAKIVLDEAPHVRELRPDAPRDVERLVARMLAKERDERFADAAQVVRAIDALGESFSPERPASIHAPSLTEHERVLLSAIVVGQAYGSLARTLHADEADELRQAHEARAAAYGARLEALADGSLVLTLTGGHAATDQAERAARAALHFSAHLPNTPVALATGWGVTAGRLPVGEVLERAVRLLDLDAAGGVRIDDVTAGLLPSRFVVSGDARGLMLTAERDAATPTRLLLGKPSPCVGRERELRTLEAIVDECVEEPVARAVLLSGPAGIGKSRLRYEILKRLEQQGRDAEVWIARGDSMRAGSPFGLLAQIVRRAGNLAHDEPADLQRRKLALRVARHVPETDRARVSEFLGEMLGLPLEAEPSVQLQAARQDALLMGDQIRRAWEEFVEAECRARFVLLVLEDLQWGDLPTVNLVGSSLRSAAELPLMVLALARPEVHDLFPGLWSERGLVELRMNELTRRAGTALVREMLGDTLSDAEVARMVEHSGGNCFYLEELIRARAEGRYSELPETVLAMVQSRLEDMEPEARRVLRAGSVFGQVFWLGGVSALLGGSAQQALIAEWLGALEAREVITRRAESRFSGQHEYTFRHALVREAAYAMLTEADRQLGHRLAAAWLEGIGESDASLLAEHFEQGGEPARAIPWWRRAAESALEANDFDAAEQSAERGIACDADGEQLGDLLSVLAEAERWRGEPERAERAARQALRLFQRGSVRFCQTAAELALLYQRLGQPGELERMARELIAVGDAAESKDALAIAALRAAVGLLLAGDHALAQVLEEMVRESTGAPPAPVTEAWLHVFHAIEALHAGDLSAYLGRELAALECYERAGDQRRAVNESVSVGYAYMELGAYQQAETTLRTALETAERLGLAHPAAAARHNLGLVVAELGRLDEALVIESAAIEAFVGQQDRRLESAGRIYLARIHLLAGEHDLAAREAHHGVELATEAAPPIIPLGLATFAKARLSEGRAEEALRLVTDALERVSKTGETEGGDALLYLAYAETLHALGDQTGASRAIATARDRLLERAAKIGDPALRRSFLDNVADNARTLELAGAWASSELS
jgi:eukaryotic-like serine/threonine-protein kinase